jgi:hypothetical protein
VAVPGTVASPLPLPVHPGIFLFRSLAPAGVSASVRSCKAVDGRRRFYKFVERQDAFPSTLLSLASSMRSPIKNVGIDPGGRFTFDRGCTE